MTYKFDKCPRWWKEIYKFDNEIRSWSIFRFMLMKECIELSLRYGNPFDASMEEMAGHIRTTRQFVSSQFKVLEAGEWLSINRGKYRGHKSTISVNWGKLDALYLAHEKEFNNMEKTFQSVNGNNPLTIKKNSQSVNGINPLGKDKALTGGNKALTRGSESVNEVNNNKNDKENDKESGTGSALAFQGQASPVQKHDPKVCEDFHKAVKDLYQ